MVKLLFPPPTSHHPQPSYMPKLSIRDLDLKNKTVFIRVDFNVPLAPGGQEITSDKRIRASLPTIHYALDHGAGVILASHLGRPKGKPNPEMSLKPVATRLGGIAGQAGRDGAGLRRTGSGKDAARTGRSAAARESAIPRRRREERSGILQATGRRCAMSTSTTRSDRRIARMLPRSG